MRKKDLIFIFIFVSLSYYAGTLLAGKKIETNSYSRVPEFSIKDEEKRGIASIERDFSSQTKKKAFETNEIFDKFQKPESVDVKIKNGLNLKDDIKKLSNISEMARNPNSMESKQVDRIISEMNSTPEKSLKELSNSIVSDGSFSMGAKTDLLAIGLSLNVSDRRKARFVKNIIAQQDALSTKDKISQIVLLDYLSEHEESSAYREYIKNLYPERSRNGATADKKELLFNFD